MSVERYRLSFTTGGLFLQEATIVAERYLALRDWKITREQVRGDNLLQVRTSTAATRISLEVIARLELLSQEELECLLDGSLRERGYLLWSAACRRYGILRDFAVEVLREHYLSLRHQLTPNDYDAFFNNKAVWHAELDALAMTTQRKLRQNLFRMLREADLLSDQSLIQPAMLTPRLAQLLAGHGNGHGHESLLIFPAADIDIQRWLT